MIEIISGLWIGNNLHENNNILPIDCNMSGQFYLSKELQIEQFMEKHETLIKLIYTHLNNLQAVQLYNSTVNKNNLEIISLLLIAFFIKYSDIKMVNLIKLLCNKLHKKIFQIKENNYCYKIIIKKITAKYRH